MVKVAVVGATGAVGREILEELAASPRYSEMQIGAFASPRSHGVSLSYGNNSTVIVQAFSHELLKHYDFVLMSAGGPFSKANARALADSGCIVIDNSSAWRTDLQIPLVVPEVNLHDLSSIQEHLTQRKSGALKKGFIIANPNCVAVPLVVALKPLLELTQLETVVASSYQSVSGSGQKGIEELASQLHSQTRSEPLKNEIYPHIIASNLIPAIGAIEADGYCDEEKKVIFETQRMLGLPSLEVLPSTVRVPVFNGHSISVAVKCRETLSLKAVLDAWKSSPGLEVYEGSDLTKLFTPRQWAGNRHVGICRARIKPASNATWLQFWCLGDNLRKGAATNAVQIFQYLQHGSFV